MANAQHAHRPPRPSLERIGYNLIIVVLVLCGGPVESAYAACPEGVAVSAGVLQQELDALEAQLRGVPHSERGSAGYRALQEQALLKLEILQCAREAAALPEAVTRGLSVDTPFAEVPLLFITDRRLLAEGQQPYFGTDRESSGVSYGRVVVTMPAERYTSGSPVPLGMRIVQVKNASDGISVRPPELLGKDLLALQIRAYKLRLPPGSRARILVFVHGFNVTYVDAAKAAARLAFGLRINVLPMIVSWPSQGQTLRYWQDEQAIDTSIERLRPIFQWLLSNEGADEVVVVAHSMGARLVARILAQLELQKVPLPKLTRVIFAAADLNQDELRELWPRLGPLPAKRWMLYTSANDFALRASSLVHDRPPVGSSRERVFSIDQAETVDASAVAAQLKGYGHSYVIDNPLLQADLRLWIVQGNSASERGLTPGSRPPAVFWELPR